MLIDLYLKIVTMISTTLIDNIIRINCSKNQLIDVKQLKQIYRASFKLIDKHGTTPIIVNTENNVQLSTTAKKIFRRLNNKYNDITLIIISG